MIAKELLGELLSIAVSTGGDFAEVFAEREHATRIHLVSGKVEAIRDQVIAGVGIRVFCGTKTTYASTSNLTREGLLACAAAVAMFVFIRKNPAWGVMARRWPGPWPTTSARSSPPAPCCTPRSSSGPTSPCWWASARRWAA